MSDEQHPARRVLLVSSGNPDATFLAAGLVQGQLAGVRAVYVQGSARRRRPRR